MRRTLTLLVAPLALAGCLDRYDYHGSDPRAYNEVIYPKKNQVEFNSVYQSFMLAEDDHFTKATIQELNDFTSRTYPSAVERLVIATPQADEARTLYVTRLLRARGFKKSVMEYVYDETLQPDEVVIQLDYSIVVSPACPDWRKSTNLNFSNTNFSHMECSTVTNIGKQVANPKDLLEPSATHVSPDGHVGAQAIGQYRSGQAAEQAEAASGESASGGATQ